MELPPRKYFHLDEVAQSWGVSVRDILAFCADGNLELATLCAGTRVEFGRLQEGTWQPLVEGQETLYGTAPISSHDVLEIATTGIARIASFKPAAPEQFIRIAEGEPLLVLTIERLVVLREERQRFEAAPWLQNAPVAANSTGLVVRHNFTEVVFNGQFYQFGPVQASILRQLYSAAVTDNPWCSARSLLDDAGASSRMADVFKRKTDPDWRKLILSNKRGLYRLNLPDRQAPSVKRSYRKVARLFRRIAP